MFVATTYLEYLRIQQEIMLIQDSSDSVEILVGKSKYYFFRLIFVYWKLLILSIRKYDVVFLSFSPQLILPFWHWKFKRKENIIVGSFDLIIEK